MGGTQHNHISIIDELTKPIVTNWKPEEYQMHNNDNIALPFATL